MLYKPEDYGAVPNDPNVDCAPHFTALFADIDIFDRRPVIRLQEGATYYLTTTIQYVKSNDRTTLIEGNNAVLKMVGEENDILNPSQFYNQDRELQTLKGSSVGDALIAMDRLHIKELRFEGGNTQLRMAATFLSIIENCHFVAGQRAIDGIFALQTQISNCWINNYRQEGILLRSGEGDTITGEDKFFSNATGSNSQSNISTISNCRLFANKPVGYGIRAYSSSNITVENTVIEGAVHKHAVHLDSRGSTTVSGQYMRNLHIEFGGDPEFVESIFYVRGGTNIHLERIYSQFGGCVQAHVKDAGQVFIEEWSYVPTDTKAFKAENGRWYFKNNWSLNAEAIGAKDPETGESLFWEGEPPWYYGSEFDFKRTAHHGFGAGFFSENASYYLNGTRLVEDGIVDRMNNSNPSNLSSKDLEDYEIVDFIPYIHRDREGKQITSLQPLLRKKQ